MKMSIDVEALKAARAELADSLRYLDEAIRAKHLSHMITGAKAVHVDADELYKVGTGRDVEAQVRRWQTIEYAARSYFLALDAKRNVPRADPALGLAVVAAEAHLRDALDHAVERE
jgi:hypothetical protein